MDKKLRLQLIMDAAGNATKFLRGIKSETETASGSLKGTRDRIADLQRATRDVRAYRNQQEAIVSNNLALSEARKKVEQLQIQYGLAEKPTQALTNKLLRAKGEVTKLTTEQQRHIGTLRDLDQRLSAAGVATADLGRHEDRLQRETTQANTALQAQIRHVTELGERTRRLDAARGRYDKTQQLAGTMQGAGASAGTAGVIVAAPMVAGARSAMELESSMTTIAQRSNMSADATRVFEQRLLATGRAANRTREETIALFDELTGQGFEDADALAMGRDVGRASTAYKVGDQDLAATAGSLRNLDLAASQTGRAFDIMAVAGKRGNFEFDAMAKAFPSLTAGVAAYGMKGLDAVADIAAAAQIARRGAGSDDEAATNLGNLVQKIGSPETARRFAAVGINLRTELEKGEAAGVSALETIIELSKRATGGDASRLGSFFEDAQVQKALRPLMSATDEYRKIRADALAAHGEVDRDFQVRMLNNAETVKALRIEADTTSVKLGHDLLPIIGGVSRAALGAMSAYNAWASANPGLSRALTITMAAVAGGLVLFGGLAMAVAAVLGPFALLQLTLTQAGILFAPVIAGLTGTGAAAGGAAIGVNALLWPVLGVVAAVALLAAGAYLIYRNWGAIGPWLGRMWGGIRAVVGGAMALITGYIMNFTPLGFIIRNWGPISNFLSALWDAVKQVVGLGIDSVKLYLLAFTPLGIIVRNWGAITGFVSGLWSSISGHVSGGIQAVKTAIANFQPLNDFKAAFAGVWTFMAELPGRLMNAGADAMRGFTQGIRGQRAAVQAAASDAAGRAETGARKRLDTHSPSRVFAAIGGDVMDGLGLGIRRGATRPVMQMRAATAALAAAGAFGVGGAEFTDRPALTFDDGPRLSASSAGAPSSQGQRGVTTIGSVTIQIIQQPGESTEDLARQVANLLSRGDLGAYQDDEMEDA